MALEHQKQLASNNLSDGALGKGRALDWKSDDRVEDGYLDTMIPKKKQAVPIGEKVRVGLSLTF